MTTTGPGDVAAIVEGVLHRDYAVQRLAKGAVAAVPELLRLLGDPDPEVRELATYCLAETGDPNAVFGLSRGTFDADAQVAMAAAKALHGRATPAHSAMILRALDHATVPAVQRELGLVLGPIAQPAELVRAKARWEQPKTAEMKEGLTVALAGRGDVEAREEFVKRLLASAREERLRWLEHADRVADTWLLPALAEVAEDRTPLIRVAVDNYPSPVEAIRACDLAVTLIAKITRARLSFMPSPRVNYTDAQIDEARQLAKASKP